MGQIVMERESENTGVSPEDLWASMKERLSVMQDAINNGLKSDLKTASGLVGSMGFKVEQSRLAGRLVGGDLFLKVTSRSLAVAEFNACMGKIVACPTAGSCGVVPACLLSVAEETGASEEAVVLALFTLGGLGIAVAERAPISGAEGGCQAECGVASAMAAAGMAELLGCSPTSVLNAASLALQNMLGLVCDPVAGLVEVPCVTRNAAAAVNALACANLARAGVTTIIPFDEAVSAMAEVAALMPKEFRETALGGIANTPTAKRVVRELARQKWE